MSHASPRSILLKRKLAAAISAVTVLHAGALLAFPCADVCPRGGDTKVR